MKKLSTLYKKDPNDLGRVINEINPENEWALTDGIPTRKFDGRRFGKKIEEVAGPEVIRRIIGGSEITKAEHEGKYYREALKARNYIKKKFNELFQEIDAIILPTVPKLPHKIGEAISIEDMYSYDVFTTPASIAGLPAISIPAGQIDNKDIGLQILAPHFQEELIFKLAKDFE